MRTVAVLVLVVLGLTPYPERPSIHQTSAGSPMLPGFTNLRFGMSVTELHAARPTVQKDDFPSSTLLVEKLASNQTFASVSYDVADQGLWRVTWSRSASADRTIASCQEAFETARQHWGGQFERKVGVIERHPATQERVLFPVVVWTTPQAHAVLTCVVSKSSQPLAPNHINLTVFVPNRKIETVVKTKFVEPLTEAEMRSVFEGVLPAATR